MASLINPGNTAVVTGASRGIGLAVARALAGEGFVVYGTTRDPAGAPALAGVEWLRGDFASAAGLSAFCTEQAGRLGRADLLVNNAGFADFGPFDDLPADSSEAHWRVMVDAPVTLARAVLPGMRKRGQGAVVNVASLAAELPLPFLSMYNVAKAGLSAFSYSLLLELRAAPIQVIDFRPGDYRTGFYGMTRCFGKEDPALERVWSRMQAHVANGPLPERAAADLLRALRRRRRGTVRSGNWFQARLAPLGPRLLPEAVLRGCLLRYYGLKGR